MSQPLDMQDAIHTMIISDIANKMLVEGLVSQGYRYDRLRNSFKEFRGRCQDLIVKYQR